LNKARVKAHQRRTKTGKIVSVKEHEDNRNIRIQNKLAKEKEIKDENNPNYALTTITTHILSRAVKGEVDLNKIASQTLAERGQDVNGMWVGFDKAKAQHDKRYPNK